MKAKFIKESLNEYQDIDAMSDRRNARDVENHYGGDYEEYYDRNHWNIQKMNDGSGYDIIVDFESDKGNTKTMSIFEVLEELVEDESKFEKTAEQLESYLNSISSGNTGSGIKQKLGVMVQNIIDDFIEYNDGGEGEWDWPAPERDGEPTGGYDY